MKKLKIKAMSETVMNDTPPDRRKKIAGAALALAAVVLIIVIAVSRGGKNSTGYDFCFGDAGGVLDITSCDRRCAVLTKNRISYISSSGKVYDGSSFSFSDPVMRENNGNVLIFDRGNKGYIIEKNYKYSYGGQTSGAIVTAALSKKGEVAYSVDSEFDSFAQSAVYFRRGASAEPVCVYKSTEGYCIALALSDDGRFVAAAVLSVNNAENVIDVIICDTESGELRESSPLSGNDVLTGFDFLSDGDLFVTSSRGVYRVKTDGSSESIRENESADMICGDICSSGYAAFAVPTNGNKFEPTVLLFARDGDPVGEFVCDKEIRLMSSGEKYCTVSCGKTIGVYNKNGLMVGTAAANENASGVCCVAGRIFCLLSDGIYITDVSLPREGEEPVMLGGESTREQDLLTEIAGEEETQAEIPEIDEDELITELQLPQGDSPEEDERLSADSSDRDKPLSADLPDPENVDEIDF